MKEGPKVDIRVNVSCDGCQHESSEKYVCQSDWGYDHYCNHPSIGKKFFGGNTPDFCPFKKDIVATAIEKFIESNSITKY